MDKIQEFLNKKYFGLTGKSWAFIIGGLLGLVSLLFAFGIFGKKKRKVKRRRRRKTTTRSTNRSKSTSRAPSNSLRRIAGIRKDKSYASMTAREKRLFNLAKARRARKRNTKK